MSTCSGLSARPLQQFLEGVLRYFSSAFACILTSYIAVISIVISDVSLGQMTSNFKYCLATAQIAVATFAIVMTCIKPNHITVINPWCCIIVHTLWTISYQTSFSSSKEVLQQSISMGYAMGMLSLVMATQCGSVLSRVLVTIVNTSVQALIAGNGTANSVSYSICVLLAVWSLLVGEDKSHYDRSWVESLIESQLNPVLCVVMSNSATSPSLSLAASNKKARKLLYLKDSPSPFQLWKNSRGSEDLMRFSRHYRVDRVQLRRFTPVVDVMESLKGRRQQSSGKQQSNKMAESYIFSNKHDIGELEDKIDGSKVAIRKDGGEQSLSQRRSQARQSEFLFDDTHPPLTLWEYLNKMLLNKQQYASRAKLWDEQSPVAAAVATPQQSHSDQATIGWIRMTSKIGGMQQSKISKNNTMSHMQTSREQMTAQPNMRRRTHNSNSNINNEQQEETILSCSIIEGNEKISKKRVTIRITYVREGQGFCAFLVFEDEDDSSSSYRRSRTFVDRQISSTQTKKRQLKVVQNNNTIQQAAEECHSPINQSDDQQQRQQPRSIKDEEQDDLHWQLEDEDIPEGGGNGSGWGATGQTSAVTLTTYASSAKQKSVFYEEFCKQGLLRSSKCVGSVVQELKQLIARTSVITESDLSRFISTTHSSSFHSAFEPFGKAVQQNSTQQLLGNKEKGVYCVPKRVLDSLLQSAIYASTVTGNYVNFFALRNSSSPSSSSSPKPIDRDFNAFSLTKMLRDIQHIFKKTISRKHITVLIQHNAQFGGGGGGGIFLSHPHLLHPSPSSMQMVSSTANNPLSSLVNLSITQIPQSQMATQNSALNAGTAGVQRNDEIINDQSKVQHLLFNLIHNAVEHTRERGRIAISISRDEHDTHLVKVRIRNEYASQPESEIVAGSLHWKEMLEQYEDQGNFFLGTRIAGKLSELVGPFQSLTFTDLYGLELQAEVLITDHSQIPPPPPPPPLPLQKQLQFPHHEEHTVRLITSPHGVHGICDQKTPQSSTSILGVAEQNSSSQMNFISKPHSAQSCIVKLDSSESFDKWIHMQTLDAQKPNNNLRIRHKLNFKE